MVIITDSAADITVEEAKQMDIYIADLEITFSGDRQNMKTVEDFSNFFDKLELAEDFPKTSQPSPEIFLDFYKKAASRGEDIIVITISSGLSGTVNSANLAKQISGYEKIWILDSEQAIISQRFLVERAVKRRTEGKTAIEIIEELELLRKRLVVCGGLDTLEYLGKGGRMPKSLAAIGNLLHIKPIIELKDKKLITLGKARGREGRKRYLWREFEKYEIDLKEPIYFGYTKNSMLAQEFMEETVKRYGLNSYRLFPVGGVIGSHVGPNCIAVSFVKMTL